MTSYHAAILLGLVAACFWGIGDLLARFSARAVGPGRAMFYSHMPGAILLSAALPLHLAPRLATAEWPGWLAGLLSAALCLGGTYALLRAFAVGRVVLVSPLVASFGAVTAGLAMATGETVPATALAGMALAVAGVALAAAPPEQRKTGDTAGIAWALVSAWSYGIGLWIQGAWAVPRLGIVAPIWIYYLAAPATIAALALPRGASLAPPPLSVAPVVFGGGILGAAAFLASAAGFTSGEIGVVAVLSSLSSAVTVLLGRFILRETLVPRQWGGVAAILAGILLIRAA